MAKATYSHSARSLCAQQRCLQRSTCLTRHHNHTAKTQQLRLWAKLKLNRAIRPGFAARLHVEAAAVASISQMLFSPQETGTEGCQRGSFGRSVSHLLQILQNEKASSAAVQIVVSSQIRGNSWKLELGSGGRWSARGGGQRLDSGQVPQSYRPRTRGQPPASPVDPPRGAHLVPACNWHRTRVPGRGAGSQTWRPQP